MSKSHAFSYALIKLKSNRKQQLNNLRRQRHLMFLRSVDWRRRRRFKYLTFLKKQHVLSVAAFANQCKERRFCSRPRSNHFWALLADPRNEKKYLETFRMSKTSFETLCGLLEPHMPKQEHFLTVPVPMKKQVAICLYKLASCAEYRVIGDVFGVHKSTVHKYFYIVINAILKLTKQYIQFPSLDESLEIAKRFEKKSNIPNIIGAIDGE